MSQWPSLIPGYPGEFTTSHAIRFLQPGSSTLAVPKLDAGRARWWADEVHGTYGLFPKGVVDTLSHGMPFFEHANIYGVDDVQEKFSVEIKCIDAGMLAIHAGVTAHLDLKDKHLGIDLAHVESGYRQQGHSAQFLMNCLTLIDALEIKRMTLHAALEDGPYVWARFGFVPAEAHWHQAKADVRAMFNLIAESLTAADRRAVEGALKSDKPTRIREIAEVQTQIPSTRTSPASQAPQLVAAGYVLLAESGIRWYGTLDLDDDAGMALFADRVRRASR